MKYIDLDEEGGHSLRNAPYWNGSKKFGADSASGKNQQGGQT
ncbi:MAG: hypothetical protein ACYDDO_03965 [Acidiferrobacterales bacterium]